jgi:hypothetical protein
LVSPLSAVSGGEVKYGAGDDLDGLAVSTGACVVFDGLELGVGKVGRALLAGSQGTGVDALVANDGEEEGEMAIADHGKAFADHGGGMAGAREYASAMEEELGENS